MIFQLMFLFILPLCSINRHDGHICCLAGLLNMILKVVTLRIIQANFVLHWHSGLRVEYCLKLRTDGRQRTPSDGKSSYGVCPSELISNIGTMTKNMQIWKLVICFSEICFWNDHCYLGFFTKYLISYLKK